MINAISVDNLVTTREIAPTTDQEVAAMEVVVMAAVTVEVAAAMVAEECGEFSELTDFKLVELNNQKIES